MLGVQLIDTNRIRPSRLNRGFQAGKIAFGLCWLVASFAVAPSTAVAQTSSPSSGASSPFTQQELWNLWQRTYATPQLLTSVDDFTRTMPVCFDFHEILRENSSEILATLKPIDVFLGPGPGPTGGWDVIYVFQVNFLNRPHNPLYKYWVRDFPADYMPVQNIPQISILTGVTKDQSGAPIFQYEGSPGFGILVSSEKDPAPQNYDDLMVFNNYGVSLGDENSSASSKCE